MNHTLTYDDIQLVPSYSKVKSRKNIRLSTLVSKRYGILNPFVASPMDTVCGFEMALKIAEFGGVGCIHRFMNIEEQSKIVKQLYTAIYLSETAIAENWGVMLDNWHAKIKKVPIMAAIGVQEEDRERAKSLVEAGANVLVIDVAHGHHQNVKEMIEWCKLNLPEHVDIIAGNIATKQAALDLQEWGADGLRVGIGGGSLCSTRVKTGFGVPNITALEDIAKVANVPIMADGGIRSSGDAAKALAIGANSVMLGSLLAGTQESPGNIVEKNNSLYKRYRGSASLETKLAHGKAGVNIEGESTLIPYKSGVKFMILDLLDGVKSALSYAGANHLFEFNPEYVIVSNAGLIEGKPHLL